MLNLHLKIIQTGSNPPANNQGHKNIKQYQGRMLACQQQPRCLWNFPSPSGLQPHSNKLFQSCVEKISEIKVERLCIYGKLFKLYIGDEKSSQKNLTTSNLLTAIKLGRELLDYLAANSYDYKTSSKSVHLSDNVSLNRLQYYRRISRLIEVGMVK